MERVSNLPSTPRPTGDAPHGEAPHGDPPHGGAPASDAPSADARDRERLLHDLASLTLPLMWSLRQASMRALEPHGLRPIQALVLASIAQGHGSPKALSEIVETAPPMMSSLLGDLEDRGLVTRSPDPEDRRRIRVDATDAGHALARAVDDAWAEASRERFADVSDDDLRTLVDVYTTLVRTP